MKKRETRNPYAKLIHIIIGLVIIAVFYSLPEMPPITHLGFVTVGVFLVTNYWYITVDMITGSFLGLISFVAFSGTLASSVIINTVGNPTIWQMLVMLAILYGMNQSGATKALSKALLSMKVFYGKSVLTVSYFLIASTLLTAMKVPVLVSMAIGVSVLNAAGITPKDRMYAPFVIADFFAASLGMSIIPYGSWVSMLLTAFEEISGIPCSGAAYIGFGLVLCVILDIVMAVMMKYVFRCDLGRVSNIEMESMTQNNDAKLSKQGKFILIMFAVTLIGSLFPTFFPKNIISQFINGRLSINMLFAAVFVLCCVVPIDGKPALNAGEALSKGIFWPLICSMATGLYLATCMSSADTGIKTALSTVFGHAFSGLPGVLMLVCSMIMCVVVTGFFSNTATCIVFMSAIVPVAASFGLNPVFVGVAIMWASMPGYLTPGGCPNSPYLHGHTEISRKDLFKYMIIYLLAFIIVDVLLTMLAASMFH